MTPYEVAMAFSWFFWFLGTDWIVHSFGHLAQIGEPDGGAERTRVDEWRR